MFWNIRTMLAVILISWNPGYAEAGLINWLSDSLKNTPGTSDGPLSGLAAGIINYLSNIETPKTKRKEHDNSNRNETQTEVNGGNIADEENEMSKQEEAVATEDVANDTKIKDETGTHNQSLALEENHRIAENKDIEKPKKDGDQSKVEESTEMFWTESDFMTTLT